jgi:hypothetical protein
MGSVDPTNVMKSPEPSQTTGHWLRWWIVGYIVLVGIVVGGVFGARPWAIAQMSSAKSISDWQEWRQEQLRSGVDPRHVPKTYEPPALVLMRDHFPMLVFGALLFSSLLYWVIAWFITGMVHSKPPAG